MAFFFVNGPRFKNLILAASKWLIFNEQELNDINVFPVPDGDTGSNMAATLKSVAVFIDNSLSVNDLREVADGMANAALMGARGNSGVILSQIFKGIAIGIGEKPKLDVKDLLIALRSGYEQAYKAIANPKEGTILTVVRESVESAIKHLDENPDITSIIDILLYEAKESVARTPNLLPILKESGVVDAGGLGFVYVLEGIYKLVHGEHIPELEEQAITQESIMRKEVDISTHYGYCSEFLITPTETINMDDFREQLLDFGDSLVLAETPAIIKVHIHTKNPGTLMDFCLKKGIISAIKIENMDEMHSDMEMLSKTTLIIAIAPGEGLKNIFKSLGCGYVIDGGQTMNPSVEDIDKIIHKSKSKNIVILPNNSNIILAAEQVKELNKNKNKNIFVVPTKSVPEGFSAMLAYSQDKAIDDVYYDMMFAINDTKSGEITRAAKESTFNGVAIKKDEIITIYDKVVKPAASSVQNSLFMLLEDMIDHDEDTIISLYYGEDISKDEAAEIEELVEDKYSEMDVEVHFGGQPHYFFFVSVE